MPRAHVVSNNFTGGELSPLLYGRTDLEKYHSSAKELENVHVMKYGGVTKRAGTIFEAEVKDSADATILVPFVFNRDQSYVLEFGDLYMRVYTDDGQVLSGGNPYEIVTPWTSAQLARLNYAQEADTMFLVHPDVSPRRLRRYGHANWVLDAIPFDPEPYGEIGHNPAASLTLSATTGSITATASAASFTQCDLNRTIRFRGGEMRITGYTSSTVVTGTALTAFESTSIAAAAWTLTGSPTAYARILIGSTLWSANVYFFVTTGLNGALSLAAKTGTGINFTASVASFAAGDVGKYIAAGTGVGLITGFTSSTVVVVTIFRAFDADSYNLGFWGMTPATGPIVTSDVNVARIAANGLVFKITSITAAGSDAARPESTAGYNPSDEGSLLFPGEWSINYPLFSAALGYPQAVALHNQSLLLAGSATFPNLVCKSVIGEYYNFTLGVEDSDAISNALAGGMNQIIHLSTGQNLFALTYGNEYSIEGTQTGAISPTDFDARARSAYGCNDVQPIRIENEILFMQRAGRKLRSIEYSQETGTFKAVDVSVYSEHITESGIVALGYQQEPYSIVYAVRADGTLAVLVYDREQQVAGWTRYVTDGLFESVAVIPNGTEDEVWVVVVRTIQGVTKRYVERFDPTALLDSAIVGTSVPGATVWAGLSHLNGKTVRVIADGVDIGDYTVSGGQITLDRTAYDVQIGLMYRPVVTLLNPDIATASGAAQAQSMYTGPVWVRFKDTVGAEVAGFELAFRGLTAELDAPPPGYSGLKRGEASGWNVGESPITITQNHAYPFTILSVIRRVTVNDG